MRRNKLGSFLLALVIALGLWLYVVNYINTTHEQTLYNVPVGLEGKSLLTERGFMILSEDDYRVNITVSGSRQDVSKKSTPAISRRWPIFPRSTSPASIS